MKMIVEEFENTDQGLKRKTREETFEDWPKAVKAYIDAFQYWEKRGLILEFEGNFTCWPTENSWITVELVFHPKFN